MYTVAVCDDERLILEEVRKYINQWNPQIQVDCFTSGEELLEHYRFYHAIFLDIDMTGMNGIETGKEIRQIDKEAKIIYLTAYRDYVAGAFEVHAFQYLLKPVRQKILQGILEEVFHYMREPQNQVILDFRTLEGMVCLPTDSIYYFEYMNRKVRIVTIEQEYYMVEKIGDIFQRTREFGFSMPHQSFVINMLHVKNTRNQQIYLDNGMEIPLSQKKQKLWKQELTNYLSKRLERQRGESG